MTIPFMPMPKIPRLRRDIVITEKIDGTNASIYVNEFGLTLFGSRNRWITTGDDPGHHFGEWYGSKIGRTYGLTDGERHFALFNVHRWGHPEQRARLPKILQVVPELYRGPFTDAAVDATIAELRLTGSKLVPGFMQPEGIVVFHKASNSLFKRTLEKDEEPKGKGQPVAER